MEIIAKWQVLQLSVSEVNSFLLPTRKARRPQPTVAALKKQLT